MVISNRDLKTIYFCPKKARYQLNGTRRLESQRFSVDAFGCTLVVEPDEISMEGSLEVKVRKSGKRVTDYHLIEAAFIGYVLESIGYVVGKIVFESPFYSLEVNWRPYVTRMLSMISHFCSESDFKVSKTHLCKICEFVRDCFNEARENERLEFIHGFRSATLQKLREAGFETVRDVVLNPERTVAILGRERGRKVYAQALSILELRPVVFSELPELSDGVILDIESFTPYDFDYLFGVLSNDSYYPFLAFRPDQESAAFEEMISFIRQCSGPVYHFHQYEVQRLKRLSQKYGIKLERNFFDRFIDVYKLYTNSVALPVPSYSLKTLARYFGFEWRNGFNGRVAVEAFENYLKTGDTHILDEILTYNEDDVRATKLLVEKLTTLKCSEDVLNI